MGVRDLVSAHYGGDDLTTRILDALAGHGADVDRLHVTDLAPIDQLHAGFAPATEYVLSRLGLGPRSRLLDVGSGIGGPSRLAAWTCSCRVAGVDLTPAFVDTARELTARVGLTDRVSFEQSPADAMPFEDDQFDAALMIHVGMNIEDKQAVFTEVHRVLAPGARFAVYEQMRTGPGSCRTRRRGPRTSGRRSCGPRGSTSPTSRRPASRSRRWRTAAVGGRPNLPADALSPRVVFGEEFMRRIGNNVAATQGGMLGAVLIVARA